MNNDYMKYGYKFGKKTKAKSKQRDVYSKVLDKLAYKMCKSIDKPEKQFDAVHKPSHYNFGKYEVIDVIDDWKLNFNRGNAIKYIARAGKKDSKKTIEDLEKAVYYLNREINNLKWEKFIKGQSKCQRSKI